MKKKTLLLTALLLTSALAACGDKNVSSNKTPNPDANATADANTEISSEEESEEEESDVTFSIGEEGILGDWSITVTNAQITDSIKENDYFGFTPSEGNKYLTIDMTITNNGKDASKFLPSVGFNDDISVKLLYQGDYEYSSTYLIGYNNEIHDTTVNPLSTKSGTVTFELPDSVASSEEELILRFSAGQSDLLFKVR